MADAGVVQGFRLSPQQERLWRQMGGEGAGACRALAVVEITGEPDPEALEKALRRICERYEILRTSFQRLPGMDLPLQVIADRGEPSLARHDWSGREPRERQVEVDRLVRELRVETPEPGSVPLFEAVWIVLGRESHLLLLALPALVADRATLANLVREIAAGYGTGGAEPEAEAEPGEPPLQYADVSEWQHYLLESPETEEGRRFWRQRAPRGAVELEADLPFPSSPVTDLPFAPQSLAVALPATVKSEAAALASRLGTTFSTLALAAWQALLERLSQRAGLVVGVAFRGRRHEDLAGVLGPLARYLPFRVENVESAGSLSFADLIARVSRTEEELEPWQEYFGGFPESDGGESAALFFPCCFERGEEEVQEEAGGILFLLAHTEACSERFRLKLVSGGVGEDPPLELHYDASAVSEAGAERLSGWYRTLFREAVCHPERRVADLGILTPGERQEMLAAANATAVSGPLQSLPDRFREQVRRSPDRIAVTDGERQLTFAGLDAAAERLARDLRRRGVGPEIRVAVGTGRSIEMVLGILGTLKAGGGYVPLDPGYPRERLAFLLEDSRAALLLVDEASRGRFSGATPPVVLLEGGRPAAAAGSPAPPVAETALDALCYVIYTSGSTGRPKGVMVPHRGIANRLQWMARVFPLSADDAVLQKTPYGFDASIWEIFSPLLAGARLVLAEPGGHQDASYLLDAVARFGVTVLQLVPSMLAVFVEQAGAAEGCRGLRRLFCGGEALSAALARRAAERLGVEVCNLYGPTETSIDATFEPGAGSLPGEGLVPLGRPLDNLRVYLLDRAGQAVPAGSPGELCVGGASLARGYIGRPELTAERFIPDGLGGSPGERLYKTGDLARFCPAGRLEFLGRIDRQVKIRGLRVEPEEIEALLCRHPLVRAAAVAPWGDSPADRLLAAYVVIAEGAPAPAPEELSEFLAGELPEHMVPGVFTRLAALPRLASGKLDRSALPRPERGERAGASRFEPPASPVEELVAALWEDLLGLPRVGRRDDFFALGGHSLLATQLTSRVRELFQVEVRMRDLFEAPTVAGLAAAVEAGLASGERPATPPLAALPRDGELPLSFAQQRLWFLDRLEPGSSAFNLTSALRLCGRLETAVLGGALDEIVRRHETLRTVFAERQGEPVQVVLPRRPQPLSAVDLSGLPHPRREPESARLLAAVAGQPFDLGRGPLARAALLRLERDEHVAVFVLHHIIADGWSMGVLVRELSALYGARVAGAPSPLPELPLQYADFARWQQRVLSGERLARELSYWRDHLAGLPPVLDLPLDRPRRNSPARRGAAERVSLQGDFAAGLESRARQERVTLFMLLLAAFEVLLARGSGQEDFAVGMPISGRDHLATEGLLGLFANTLVLRADLSGDPRLPELLGRVRAEVLEAFTHQDLPFEKLVQELSPRRSLAHSPLFQVMFGLQNERPAAPELPGIELSALVVPQSAAKYDLTLLLSGDAGGLDGVLEYDPDRFDRTTILRLRGQLEVLLRGVMATPGRRISELPLLPAAARAQVLAEWNDTPGGRPPEAGLATEVAAQAARTPDRVAIVAGAQTWTYGELVRRAARLALRLRERGVGPDVLVGVCLERSPEMVAALLGVLGAGGAYLPLDPGYPPGRLRSMLADSGVRRVLAAAGPGEILPTDVERLEVEALWAGPRETALIAAETALDALCYVIYTSGSTGRPKGVMVPHRGIANRLQWMARVFPLSADDAVLQKTPYGFDASIWEIFSPLLAGARLVLAEPGGHQDASCLLDAVARFGVTVLQLVPSMLAVFVEQAGAAEGCRSLRRLFCGGEALSAALARRAAEHLGVAVCNLYGPTETSIDATFEPGAGSLPGEGLVPLGRPLDNLRIYLLDRAGQAVPAGSPGELCVGGASLARGYLGRPELTAERFIPDGLGGSPGERLYRTGDLARFCPAGRLEFLGRIDRQVKIRGLRVEPGEIEAVLCLAPGIREAAVVAWPGPGGDLRLVAYLVPRDEPPRTETVAAFLRDALPPQLLPTAFVPLPALPRTPNGKLDRGALPDLTGEQLHPRADFVAPRTAVEESLAEIWAELLGLDRVGAEDDFFALGGHSLLAARVAARVWEVLGVTLPVRDLFVAPRLAELAARIEERMLLAASTEQIEDLIAALEEMDPEAVSEEELLRSLRR